MLQNVVTVGPLLAGTAAFLALILSLTRGTRLNHRERTLRESMGVLEANSIQRASVSELHLQTVAEIVARQASGKWRFWWPWAFLLFVAAAMAEIAFRTTKYVERGGAFGYVSFVSDVGGGDPGFLILPVFILVGSPMVVAAYRHSVFERAAIAHEFYIRGTVRSPASYIQMIGELDQRPSKQDQGDDSGRQATDPSRFGRFKHGMASFLAGVHMVAKFAAPGVSAAVIGVLGGLKIALNQIPWDAQIGVYTTISGGLVIVVLVFTASFLLAINLWMDERAKLLTKFRSGPHPHESAPGPSGWPISYI